MSVRRCTRCERLYSDGEDGQCRYHPGQHYRLGWTCCRDPSFSAPGCRFGSHVEDLNMTRALDEVLASAQPVCPPAAPLDSASRDSDSDSTSGPEPVIVFEDPSGTMSVASVACGGEEPAATPPSPHCLESVQAAPAAAAADGDDEEEANEERRGWFLVPYLVGPHDSFNTVSTQLDSQRSDGCSHDHTACLFRCACGTGWRPKSSRASTACGTAPCGRARPCWCGPSGLSRRCERGPALLMAVGPLPALGRCGGNVYCPSVFPTLPPP